ncbi:MAG: sugar transferase, partial [Acutalibacteraceae bacterium]|nr:sugar transferase [Acutalibacteraceae bacterium]
SPIMLVTALAVKIQDGGPILFRQNRITRNGKFFNILKFRSMIVGADKIKGVKKTEKDDKRITKVGRVIRKYRIDELPQLFNVLMGSMSMVGPRPENAENVYEYSKANPEFELRHRVKAGITGFAQIYGKHNTSPENKLKMDLTYIETYSILRDVKLMILTVKTIFTKNSAEGFEHSQEEE